MVCCIRSRLRYVILICSQAQLKVNLRPLWSPAAGALAQMAQRFGDEVWSLAFAELKMLYAETSDIPQPMALGRTWDIVNLYAVPETRIGVQADRICSALGNAFNTRITLTCDAQLVHIR